MTPRRFALFAVFVAVMALQSRRQMVNRNAILALVVAIAAAWPIGADAGAVSQRPVDFATDVAPVFEKHCIRCHQPAVKKGDLSLATLADLSESAVVVAGDPDASYLLEVVSGDPGKKPLMPKEGPVLSAQQIAVIRQWIAEGAHWPEKVIVKERSKADRNWWSLRPLSTKEPSGQGIPPAWSANPIDRFIHARLTAAKLQPSPPADRRTLIRRVTYDLTGLPPAPAEIEAFVNDPSSDSYEKLVDRLLASPRYGEQYGRHWLDVVRFGESTGFEVNHLVDNAWPYRDYVIRSLNDDKRFNRFIMEQLAGDSLGPGDPAVEIGLAFLVCGPVDIVVNSDPVQAAQIRADGVDEMIRAVSEAFLGLTVGCARCHDHKFDPVTQRDYYSLYATLAGVHHGDRIVASKEQKDDHADQLAKLDAQRKRLQDAKAVSKNFPEGENEAIEIDKQLADLDRKIAALPKLPSLPVGRFEQPAADQHIFERGDAQRKGVRVVPASISTLADVVNAYDLPADSHERNRRLAFANWIVANDNPLTPRVLVNRLWQYHFSTGIVATPNDFGYMGERPTHPELLDWLASRLVADGWRLKSLQKLIVTSQTYRQSSTYRDDAAKIDGTARLLWRFPPQRLSAEEIRDTMLFVAGKLDVKMGGPGFRLYQYSRDNVATYTPLDTLGPETYRRSVYHQNARASRIDLLSDFDAPDCAFSASRRISTTTPSQALALMNHGFTVTMAEALSERVTTNVHRGDATSQIEAAFEIALGRKPKASEEAAAIKLVEQYGLRAFSRALLNSSEMIYVN
jgi:mono/diheme cytochrome c family protein